MASKQRSGAYNGSDEGRKKKQAHNAARARGREDVPSSASPPPTSVVTMSDQPVVATPSPDVPKFKESVIEYTRLIMTHTEGRKVSRDEALATLIGVVRQRSLDST